MIFKFFQRRRKLEDFEENIVFLQDLKKMLDYVKSIFVNDRNLQIIC